MRTADHLSIILFWHWNCFIQQSSYPSINTTVKTVSHKFQEISSFNYRSHEFDKSSLLVNLCDNVPISSRSGTLVPWVYKTLRASEKGWNERFAETIETVTGLLVVGQPAGDSVKISWTSHQRIPLCVPAWIELINFFETVFLWQLDIPEIHRLIFKTSRGKIS